LHGLWMKYLQTFCAAKKKKHPTNLAFCWHFGSEHRGKVARETLLQNIICCISLKAHSHNARLHSLFLVLYYKLFTSWSCSFIEPWIHFLKGKYSACYNWPSLVL
jgi:hypothetical protein